MLSHLHDDGVQRLQSVVARLGRRSVTFGSTLVLGLGLVVWSFLRADDRDLAMDGLLTEVGTGIALIGIVWYLERQLEARVEERNTQLDANLRRIEQRISGAGDIPATNPLADRAKILADYEEQLADRLRDFDQMAAPPPQPSPSDDDNDGGEQQPAWDDMSVEQQRIQSLAKIGEAMQEMAFELEYGDDRPDHHADHDLDPVRPLTDWFRLVGTDQPSSAEAYRRERHPRYGEEIATRFRLTALFSRLFDRADGLRVYHLVALGCFNIGAIACDAHLIEHPNAHLRRPSDWKDPGRRWQAVRPGYAPQLAVDIGEWLTTAAWRSLPDTREIHVGGPGEPWHGDDWSVLQPKLARKVTFQFSGLNRIRELLRQTCLMLEVLELNQVDLSDARFALPAVLHTEPHS